MSTDEEEPSAHVATEENDADAQSAPTHFMESDEVDRAIRRIGELLPEEGSVIVDSEELLQLSTFVEFTLQKYQECPQLVKHHLGAMIEPLIGMLTRRLPALEQEVTAVSHGLQSAANSSEFVVKANALGQNFDHYDLDAKKSAAHTVARLLYIVAKVSGYKSCTGFFPHEVKHMERVFYCLQYWRQSLHLHREWEIRYCLLLWLANLVLVPFALQSIDSTDDTSLSEKLLATAISFLSDPGKCRDAAALAIGRMMTRPDASALRASFMRYARGALIEVEHQFSKSSTEEERFQLERPDTGGILLALAITFKVGMRQELVPFAEDLIPKVSIIALKSKDSFVCKTAIKALQRLGLTCLPQRAQLWRYKKSTSNLEANLRGEDTGTSVMPLEAADDNIEVPEGTEIVVDVLLQALSHESTIVRYSASKGIGRLTERLPKPAADDILNATMSIAFEIQANEAGWHGGCLAIAELCRRNALLPARFQQVLPIIEKALLYDICRGSYSVGANVRDAGCYVCWSVARAYDAADLHHYVNAVASSLVVAALCDREVNVRRAAAAAFQECVGRLGNFPRGIEIVQLADFFSLSNVKHSYGEVLPKIAAFDEYRDVIVHHLSSIKLSHWDREIRRAASTALGRIASLCGPDFVTGKLVPKLLIEALDPAVATRHGALCAIGDLFARNSIPAAWWSEPQIKDCVTTLCQLDSRRLFRGRGGEYIRQACCTIIENIALAALPLPPTIAVESLGPTSKAAKTQGKLQKFLEETWCESAIEWLQQCAVDAFRTFSRQYYTEFSDAFHGKIVTSIFSGLSTKCTPNTRRGNALALGALPFPITSSFVSGSQEKIIDAALKQLSDISRFNPTQPDDQQDPELRRNAIASLCCLGVQLVAEFPDTEDLRERHARVLSAVLAGFDDYALDKRGDVGSFVRIAAIEGLSNLLEYHFSNGSEVALLDQNALTLAVAALLKQSVEKIDRVRGIAGRALLRIFQKSLGGPLFNSIASPLVREVASLFLIAAPKIVDWSNPLDTFGNLMGEVIRAALARPESLIVKPLLEGVATSVGGLTVHVVKPSLSSICFALNEDPSLIGPLTTVYIDLLVAAHSSERLCVPLFTTVDKLIDHRLFDLQAASPLLDSLAQAFKVFSKDIQRLLPLVCVLATLCKLPSAVGPMRSKAWHQMLLLLASRYPKVRALSGLEFYTALTAVSSRNDGPASTSEAAAHLLVVQWDDTSAVKVRTSRDKLYALLGLVKPDATTAEDVAAVAAPKKKQDHSSYKSLVDEAGF